MAQRQQEMQSEQWMRINLMRIKRYGVILILIWIIAIAASTVWALHSSNQSVLDLARNEARASFNKDLVYRRWATLHGGVYVPVTDDTPPNPYLDVPNRDVTTTDGLELTLINPAYMTRQVHELGLEQYGTRGHITSLNPLNPANAPDDWEAAALRSFEQGVVETSSISILDGQEHMRYMHIMIVEEGCLKCHAGYAVGDVRGGISVSVPMQPYWDVEASARQGIYASHPLLLALGIAGIIVASRHLLASARSQELADKTAQENAIRYKVMTSTTGDGFFMASTDGRLLEVNDALCRMTGCSQDELLSMTIADLEVQESPEETREHIQKIIENGTDRFESQHRCKDGRAIDVEVNTTFIPEFGHLVGFVHNITERLRAERALSDSEERYRTLFDNAPVGIGLSERDGYVLMINQMMERLWGYSRQEFEQIIDPNRGYADIQDRKRLFKYFERDGFVQDFEVELRRKDGTLFFGSLTLVPLTTQEKTLLLTILHDITERKRLEKETRESAILRAELQKEKEIIALKERFVTTVSHEFRTPLTVIQTSTDLLSRYLEKLTNERRAELLQQIQTQISRMTSLLNNTLAISRTQSGKVEFNPAPLEVMPFCRDIFDQAKFTDRDDHQFEFTSQLSDHRITVDANLLQHILMNLLSNAIKYTPANGRITFQLALEGKYSVFRVTDEGIGIPQEDRLRLFEVFHRAKNVGNAEGTGLGLAIVKQYVDLHGGRIAVESEVGKGSTFTILLPVG